MAVLQASVTLFAHIIGALLIATGVWGLQDASASKDLTPPSSFFPTFFRRSSPSPANQTQPS